jgi:hypothetical protein
MKGDLGGHGPSGKQLNQEARTDQGNLHAMIMILSLAGSEEIFLQISEFQKSQAHELI